MLRVTWADKALHDLQRLYLFQSVHNGAAAAENVAAGLLDFIEHLPTNPRVWRQLKQFHGEIRRGLWSRYEIRYEIDDMAGEIRVIRLFEQRENRQFL
ncbi:Plasmid stabilisation system protein [Bordetella ansorpii]|uniref:Plasmid stabilisation system protein n=1 Tax=Bordetella ansorpii TaxID=288768 RepID=A0A157PBF1_9BORD|nr:type II toxin-antitoxin system RelE/ParE family toxin [Bordetella ansorpii]SAI30620.1 Plasmid stabilisation system protein [Bordetella ansorpii]